MRVLAILALCAAVVAAVPSQRIVGGSLTTIDQYPGMAACLNTNDMIIFSQYCGGNILNSRSILTAAHCTRGQPAYMWRFRVGSTFANSGGVVHNVQQIIQHPNYNIAAFLDYDFTILRSASAIVFNNNVRPVSIAGPNYNVADNQVVWAAGWGATEDEVTSEQLRHVQVYTINLEICRNRYSNIRVYTITDNMLCSGVLDVGGRDQCQQDSGGPLLHNGVLVGICSFGFGCAQRDYPGVNARVSSASTWIQNNA